jgi:hypothetical protein
LYTIIRGCRRSDALGSLYRQTLQKQCRKNKKGIKTMKNYRQNNTLLHNANCFALHFALLLAGSAVLSAPAIAASSKVASTAASETVLGVAPLTPSDCSAMRAENVISERNPLPCGRLARVRFSYIDFEGHQKQDGEMIVMDAVASHVQRLMIQLQAAKFPLHSAHALTYYAGDDVASMADNNSSAFNGRPITGGSSWSKHAYGAAIDVNPLQNPYLSRGADGQLSVLPASAKTFADRSTLRPGMTETIRGLFADNGFLVWGGDWKQPIDYQHFEIGDRAFIEKLARSDPKRAAQMFDRYVRTYQDCVALRKRDAARQTQCLEKTMRSVD